MSVRLLAIVSLLALAPQSDLATFQNHNRTFQLELPADWRLLAPNEAVQLREAGGAPPDLQRSEPRYFYAVGPVERWLKGELDGAWLHVVEVNEAWYIEDDFRDQLREGWRARGEQTGTRHELEDVHLEKLGTQQVESVVATRTSTPKDGAPYRVLEVHVPTARQQLSLSFGCHPARTNATPASARRRWRCTWPRTPETARPRRPDPGTCPPRTPRRSVRWRRPRDTPPNSRWRWAHPRP